jgi:hypothetical protein
MNPGVSPQGYHKAVGAYQKATGIQVEWVTQTEVDMDRYKVEKSADGRTFTRAGAVKARGAIGSTIYEWLDAQPFSGANYYRIKGIETTSKVHYSKVVKVNLAGGKGSLVVYPSPLMNNEISMQLSNAPKGKYLLTLSNNLGQDVWRKSIEHAGGSSSQSLSLPANLAKGIYQLTLSGTDWRATQQVFKQ